MIMYIYQIVILLLLASGVMAQSDFIRHPIEQYYIKQRCKTCPVDSTQIGRISYDPLPAYNQQSKITLEYYSEFSWDKGAYIEIFGYDKSFEIYPMRFDFPEKISVGDTLIAEFMIKPMRVGILPIVFRPFVDEEFEFASRHFDRRGFSLLRADINIGYDSTLFAMNSEGLNSEYNTYLGPLPEIMAESLLYIWHPHNPGINGLLDMRKVEDNSNRCRYFLIESSFFPAADEEGYRRVVCRISPFHAYDSGIRFRIDHSDDIEIKDQSEDYNNPVTPVDTIEFSFEFRKNKPAISRISLCFESDNPDKGNKLGIGFGDFRVVEIQRTYIGYDEDMNLMFITDKSPSNSVPQPDPKTGKMNIPRNYLNQKELDRRVNWIQGISERERQEQ
ncbi:MAG: hypothetical protein ABIE07_10200 [Candidatus Zixiibacteriota bacterium]